MVTPSSTGATNWWSPTYDPHLDLMMVPVFESAGMFFSSDDLEPEPGRPFFAGAPGQTVGPRHVGIVAIAPDSGNVVWRHRRVDPTTDLIRLGGLLSTRSGLTFGSDRELFYALDSRSGGLLWSFHTGAPIVAAPITYEREGVQYVAVASGRTLIAFAVLDSTAPTEH
jgi:alcohol dehydrogenase (cytochrome c)